MHKMKFKKTATKRMKKAQNEPMEGVQWEGGTGEKKNAKTNTNTHATKKNERKKIKITEEPKPGLGAAKPSRAEPSAGRGNPFVTGSV